MWGGGGPLSHLSLLLLPVLSSPAVTQAETCIPPARDGLSTGTTESRVPDVISINGTGVVSRSVCEALTRKEKSEVYMRERTIADSDMQAESSRLSFVQRQQCHSFAATRQRSFPKH